jgi:dienelactone hydrolase
MSTQGFPITVKWHSVLLAFVFCSAIAVTADPQTFDPGRVGPPSSNSPAEIFVPAGTVPAAVVLLHGCDGVKPHYRAWAQRLVEWGYAALLIDSFRPRGFTEVCNRGRLVPPEAQARDAFDGAAYLRATLHLRAGRVGVIGFSHGGWAVLKAVLGGVVRRPNETSFAAAVAFYSGCEVRDAATSPLETDTLILIGDADDWTPADRCAGWRAAVMTNGHTLQLKTYPGARHGFDGPLPPHFFPGHYVGQDPAALADALIETRRFLDARLRVEDR